MTDQVASAGPEEAPLSAPAGAEITVARAEPVWFEPRRRQLVAGTTVRAAIGLNVVRQPLAAGKPALHATEALAAKLLTVSEPGTLAD